MSVWRFWVLPLAAVFLVGSLAAEVGQKTSLENSVYKPPIQYEVVRRDARVTYFAHGLKVMACDPVAPFVAQVFDAAGTVLDTRAIRQSDGSVAAATVTGGVASGNTFFANGLWFKPRPSRMQQADHFFVVVRCDLKDGETIDARFGPLRIPAVGKRYAYGGFKAAGVYR